MWKYFYRGHELQFPRPLGCIVKITADLTQRLINEKILLLPAVLAATTLLSIPSPWAFLPTIWNSYNVEGFKLLTVINVLPTGLTGTLDQSADVPASRYLECQNISYTNITETFSLNSTPISNNQFAIIYHNGAFLYTISIFKVRRK